jgi:hypothetical protein
MERRAVNALSAQTREREAAEERVLIIRRRNPLAIEILKPYSSEREPGVGVPD